MTPPSDPSRSSKAAALPRNEGGVRPRLIPCLLLKNGLLVRSQLFKVHQVIGNPVSTIMRLSDWNVDEVILLDISKTEGEHDLRRDDLQIQYAGSTAVDVLREVSRVCSVPFTVGGRIRTIDDIRERLRAGADKVTINSEAIRRPELITEAANLFGAQCIVVSIDAKKKADGSYEVHGDGGQRPTGLEVTAWAKKVESLGAGEIFLNSIDRDGSAMGYDLDLVTKVTRAVTIPVIVCGGVGTYEDFAPGVLEGNASAVSAANIFHFFELSYPLAKKACIDAGVPMRPVTFASKWQPREPKYDYADRDRRIARRIEASKTPLPADTEKKGTGPRWCTRCVYPAINAAPMEFDENGVCMGCVMSDVKNRTMDPKEWARRKELLRSIFDKYRSKDGSTYDCVIAVSGGKDSYFQTHVIKHEFGLNPLLVTYNGNNWLPAGWENMHRMKEVFGCDHILCSPSVDLLKKLNRLGFIIMGDMNWHAHLGITSTPVQVAAKYDVPLVIWGEHGYLDLCGQFSMDDFPEMSYRDRLEHFARSYEWNYMVGLEGITAADMNLWKYPTDQKIFDLDLRGIYIGNYVYWEANEHAKMMVEKYGFKTHPEPFERTYRRMSNLDDMHENGMHDYLKYIKFGYGRCTDHVCKDIRAGLLSRDEGIERVKKMDHIKSKDLARWLSYTGMTEDEFDRIADTFRDPRVWRRVRGEWVKDNLWD
ncbi:MAG: imidazole glycerol phosphate synthase subunit HisF [Deltaproteobacteria bacterium]|nr:imidazole glycerol phosphate synthase subunit HisF [Deltaproteobacteria bacterium]